MPASYDGAEVPPKILTRLRALCLALPEAYEEAAWVGTRWMVRKRTFAHVLTIYGGRPRAYARAAGSDGPQVVMTLRSKGKAHAELCARGEPFFHAPWGATWGTQVVGVELEKKMDWKELKALIAESHRLLAPKKLR
jgi:predicted DNA-binding protein (MmcQ/YjbR family)